uniref:metal ABC transporter solute-binding protein, Zn/Mn family n=1 Tax=Castellaniella defragrans TaxID=75697 RepID=UPI00333F35AD
MTSIAIQGDIVRGHRSPFLFAGRFVRAWVRRRWALCVGLVIAWLALGAVPSGARAQEAPDPIRVVATFSILADMVREVGGDRVVIETIVGPNGDAHAFEPTPRDARALGAARVLVRNGLGFEGWLPRLLESSGFKGLDIVASEGVRPRILSDDEESEHEDGAHGGGQNHDGADRAAHQHDHAHAGDVDPHAWQDLVNGVIYVHNIARGLAAIDPAHAGEYHQRAEDYAARLEAEDRAWRASLAAIPQARRVIMTSHDAFGYLGRAYGIGMVPVLGLSSEAEPSAGTIARLVDRIRARDIHAVFLEKAVNPALMRRLTEDTGARIGGTLYADTLDAPGTPAGTYLGMFRWNTRQILAAFER